MAAGASTTLLLVEDVADPEKRGCTLVRMILGFDLLPAVPLVVSGVMRATVGIGLASDDAFAAAALPEVDDQTDYPQGGWLFRGSWTVRDEAAISVPFVRVDRDVRAMRKIDRSSVYIRIATSLVEGSAFSVIANGQRWS